MRLPVAGGRSSNTYHFPGLSIVSFSCTIGLSTNFARRSSVPSTSERRMIGQYQGLSVCRSVSVSVCQCVGLSVCRSVSVSVCQCVGRSVSLSVCLSVYQCVCQCVSQSVSQSVRFAVCVLLSEMKRKYTRDISTKTPHPYSMVEPCARLPHDSTRYV